METELRMSLAEWAKKNGIYPTHPTTEKGAVSVVIDSGKHTGLWSLTDFEVSSVSGSVVWLVPRSRLKVR